MLFILNTSLIRLNEYFVIFGFIHFNAIFIAIIIRFILLIVGFIHFVHSISQLI